MQMSEEEHQLIFYIGTDECLRIASFTNQSDIKIVKTGLKTCQLLIDQYYEMFDPWIYLVRPDNSLSILLIRELDHDVNQLSEGYQLLHQDDRYCYYLKEQMSTEVSYLADFSGHSLALKTDGNVCKLQIRLNSHDIPNRIESTLLLGGREDPVQYIRDNSIVTEKFIHFRLSRRMNRLSTMPVPDSEFMVFSRYNYRVAETLYLYDRDSSSIILYELIDESGRTIDASEVIKITLEGCCLTDRGDLWLMKKIDSLKKSITLRCSRCCHAPAFSHDLH